MTEPLRVMHFSDVLCVWAYVAHRRIEQLQGDFGDQVQLSTHFIPVYADVHRRIERSGIGNEGYGRRIHAVAGRFDHVEIHPQVFVTDVPTSSNASHRYLWAVKLLEQRGELAEGTADAFVWTVRSAFFRDGVDVSARARLDGLAEAAGLPTEALHRVLDSGHADAELAHDAELQRTHKVPVSPSLVLNDGRQLLNGNVGYRVLEANVRELLNKPEAEASWC